MNIIRVPSSSSVVIILILIITLIVLAPRDVDDTQRIYPGSAVSVANYVLDFDMSSERVWGAGYGNLRVLFDFIVHADFLAYGEFTFELISFAARLDFDIWEEGFDYNGNYTSSDNYYHYIFGRVDGPVWECDSQIIVIADIASNLDLNTIYHVEEELNINCWG